jgi:hypothetical protein
VFCNWVRGWYTSWRGMGKRVGYFFSLGGDLVYSSIVLASLCGDVHKRRVYIGVFLEGNGILDPDPCKVCSLLPSSWKWKRVVASSWKWNSDPGLCCAGAFRCCQKFGCSVVLCGIAASRKESFESMLLASLVLCIYSFCLSSIDSECLSRAPWLQ